MTALAGTLQDSLKAGALICRHPCVIALVAS